MIDFDELDKQDVKLMGMEDMSRSGSGTSLPGERPGNDTRVLSHSGSTSSLTSPGKRKDGTKPGGWRANQYQRQSQDVPTPKIINKELDVAIQSVKEEMKLFLAQQKLSLQQDLQRGLEPVNEELRRLAALTEHLERGQRATEDRLEDEMTEVTKGMTRLSDEGQKSAKQVEKHHKELKRVKERLEEAEERVQLVQQGFMELQIRGKANGEDIGAVKVEMTQLKDTLDKPMRLADRFEAELWEVRNSVAQLLEQDDKAATMVEDASKRVDGLDKEFQALRQHLDGIVTMATTTQEEPAPAAAGPAPAADAEARERLAALEERLAGAGLELARLAERVERGEGPAAREPEAAESPRQPRAAQRLEEELLEVKEGLARLARLAEADGVNRDHEILQQEFSSLKHRTNELTAHASQMQKDFADSIGSIREELIHLTDLTVGCLSKAKDLPTDLESLRRDVAALQERSAARSVEGTVTPLSDMESGPLEGEDLIRTMASVRKELLRAKDLFQSGQRSAGVVLSDVEILRQDLQALKESHPSLGESSIEQLRNSLRQELADEFRSLAEELIAKCATS